MTEFKYLIQDPIGIHARPAGVLAKEIAKFAGTMVKITKGEKAGTLSKSKAVIDPEVKARCIERVEKLLSGFVLYPELDLQFLEENFPVAEGEN